MESRSGKVESGLVVRRPPPPPGASARMTSRWATSSEPAS